jgi:hypothetical protein
MKEIAPAELAFTIRMLARLTVWFDEFGNYTRANDCRRLLDGLQLYSEDILRPSAPEAT